MTDILTLEITDGIAELCLNRPERKNALSEALFAEIAATGERLKSEPGLRAVILSGAGGDFCAGIDLQFLQAQAGNLEAMRERLLNPDPGERANWAQKPCYVWQELSVPVIAAIEGVCLGGGLQLALAADFRIARADARLSIMEAKWGIIPDMGITQNLPKLMAADRAKRLMMTAAMFSGEDALGEGLVTELAEAPLQRARAFAQELAGRSPEALAGIKELVEQAWTLPAGEGLKREAELQAPIIGSPNQFEAVMANMQKRPPKYR
ncbi:Enoyl-CoA hydratase [Candidatus Rhodobacter oscarellae]|uniref:Enoyl-CoA hydratase n=1 Tax=Candidatus Rhodobacter oscarellae TaxID=1675527 RepID=A0A0J9E603_9RHOB|nr:crotonase/enoyl-CoA hydratase family protein [Candidatus Rhodobacter lobularis]KMW58180.1 Enoyl-CoA hydratase [Candidatus Rhodobacter lobularis]